MNETILLPILTFFYTKQCIRTTGANVLFRIFEAFVPCIILTKPSKNCGGERRNGAKFTQVPSISLQSSYKIQQLMSRERGLY